MTLSTSTPPLPPLAPLPPAPPPSLGAGVDPAAIAAHIDPASIAVQMAPGHPGVEVAQRFFGWLDGAVAAAVFIVAFLLVARLIQAWMLHRSINKSIESQSSHAGALIDKINKPFEASGPGEMPGDDRNGLVLVAIGLAMGGFGIVQGGEDVIRIAIGAALFPLFVGVALLIRRQLVKREIERELVAERG
ncbi:MAG: hypothetical protein ABL882_01660 [Sphingopyxis sp.]